MKLYKTLIFAMCSLVLIQLTGCPKTETPPGVPATPAGFRATAGDQKITLEWTANSETNLKSYRILSENNVIPTPPIIVSATTTQFVVTGLLNKSVYAYRILAEDTAGKTSAPSEVVTATPTATPPPAVIVPAPSNVTALAQDGQVLVSWSIPVTANLSKFTVFYGASAGSLSSSLTASASVSSTIVTGLTNGKTYYFALEAENASAQKSVRSSVAAATPAAALLAPVVSSVGFTAAGSSTQVRQGAGTIEVTVDGSRLETVSAAQLAGSITFTIASKTATRLVLNGSVPHGASIGLKALALTSSAGSVSLADAIEITKIVAAKNSGFNPSDTTGAGTPNKPFLTLGKALSVARGGDTVLLGAGTYTNEDWSLSEPNVPAGVGIEGQSSDRGAVILDGADVSGANLKTALRFAGDGSAKNLTIRNFYQAITLNGGAPNQTGTVGLENIAVVSNQRGLFIPSAAALNISKSEFVQNPGGLEVRNVLNTTIVDTKVTGGGEGIQASATRNVAAQMQSANLFMDRVEVSGNSLTGVRIQDVEASVNAMNIKLNQGDGVEIRGTSATTPRATSLQGNITGNGGNGIGIYGTPGNVSVEAGSLMENNAAFQLLESREPNAFRDGGYVTTLLAATFNNPAVVTASVVVPTTLSPAGTKIYQLVNAGNALFVR